MIYGIVFEKAEDEAGGDNLFYAHIPALGLTTHGEGVEGARAAAAELAQLWVAEKRAAGETIRPPKEFLFSTVEVPDDALQSA